VGPATRITARVCVLKLMCGLRERG
jgi:hypothetical protein